jgi:hypothetical protein
MPDDKPGKSETLAVAKPTETVSLDVQFEAERRTLSQIEWGVTGGYAVMAVAITVWLQTLTEIAFPTPVGMAVVLALSVFIRAAAKGTMRVLPWPTSDRTPDVWAVMSDARILAYAGLMEDRVIALSREAHDPSISDKLLKMKERLKAELEAYRDATRDLRDLQRMKVRRKGQAPKRMIDSIALVGDRRTAAETAVQKLIDAYDELIATYVARRHGKQDGDAEKIVDDLLETVGKKDEAAEEADKDVEKLTEIVT